MERWQRRAVYTLMAISTLFGTGYFFFAIFQCGLPGQGETFWQKKISGHCYRPRVTNGVGFTHAIVNAVTDVLMAALPIPMIRKSRIKKREKQIIYGILFLAAM